MSKKVSLVARMGAGIKAFGAGFGAGISTFQPYEGAGFSRKRPVIYGAHARDSRLDLNEATRTELLKLARHMYRNVGLIKGAVDSIATYSIGPGLRPQYRGNDQEFGRLCEEYWRDMVAPSPEVTGRMTWTDMLLTLSRSIDVDGDVFVVMTEKGKLQIVEGHRVCEGDDYGTADGVFLGKLGEPTAYLIQTGELYRKLGAETVIHLMELERPDQIRGGSSLARALNHVRDLKMLGEFEKDALKLQGSIAAVITTDQGDELAGQGGFFGTVQAQDSGEATIAREEITSSATIPRLAPGEKIEMVGPNRPHAGFEPFAKFLIRDVAMGLGLPVEFVYDPASVGGAGMRFIVAKAQRRFEQRQRLLIDRFCNRAWRYFIGGAIANGDLPAVEDYAKVTWQTPKSLTVDAGREAQQAREDYKAGLSSLQDYFGELGLDWEEQVRQIAKEREFIASIGTVTPQTDVAAPVEAVKEAPAIDEPTPVNPEKDPNAGPDAELSAVVELNMPDPTPGENESAFMDRCMTETSMIKEYPDQDKRQTACKLRFTSKTKFNMPDPTVGENESAFMDRCMTDRAMVKEYPDQDNRQDACKLRFNKKTEFNMPDPSVGENESAFMDRCMTEISMIKEYPDQDKRQVACKLRFTNKTEKRTEAFTMKDDPDFNLSAKELDMVAKAVGLKDKKHKTIRKK
jgi:lambda family phage portal protein